MARESDFMKWIQHQIDTDADLKRKVEEDLNQMMIEQKLTAPQARRASARRQMRRTARQ